MVPALRSASCRRGLVVAGDQRRLRGIRDGVRADDDIVRMGAHDPPRGRVERHVDPGQEGAIFVGAGDRRPSIMQL